MDEIFTLTNLMTGKVVGYFASRKGAQDKLASLNTPDEYLFHIASQTLEA